MKKPVIILFITAVMLSCIMTVNIHAADKNVLTPEFLASGKWVKNDDSGCTFDIKFTVKGSFKISHECHASNDWIEGSGSYKIQGNKIIFKIEEGKNGEDSPLKTGDTGEAVLSDTDSLQYRWYLDLGFTRIANINSEIKSGEPVSITSVDAISTGKKYGIVTTSLKMRERPDTSAKEILLDICADGLHSSAKSIEKDKELVIYARTKEQNKVGKWNNYWYYIEFNDNSCEDGAYNSGWVFGEFVKIK